MRTEQNQTRALRATARYSATAFIVFEQIEYKNSLVCCYCGNATYYFLRPYNIFHEIDGWPMRLIAF
jgi:hypothetical protein